MAESGLTLSIQLVVLHLPSPTRSAWRAALAETAARMDWDVITLTGREEACVRPGVNTLIQGDDGTMVPAGTTDVVVMAGTPEDAVDAVMHLDSMDLHGALRHAAACFARGSHAAETGADVLAAGHLSHIFRGLGEIARGPGDEIRSSPRGQPLAFYSTLPPPVGASAMWPPEAFIWTPGAKEGVVDLTGRRRVIMYGPYLVLVPGTWTVDVVFELDIHRAISELRFEWGIMHDVDRVAPRLTLAGQYSVSMSHSWIETGGVELRIWLDRSMFDGTLKVLSVKVTRGAGASG